MKQYLQTQCYEVTELDIHFLLDCPAPEGFDDLIELATELQSDEELRRDLRYMISYAGVSANIATTVTKRVDHLLALLSDNTNPEGQ